MAKRLDRAVSLLNRAPRDTLALLLPKLLQRMAAADPAAAQPFFSPDEAQQLADLFDAPRDDLALMLDACAHLFDGAAAAPASKIGAASKFEAHLLTVGLEPAAARRFADAWEAEGGALLAVLCERSAIAPTHLRGVEWQLQVESATSNGARVARPRAQFCLELGGGPGDVGGGGDEGGRRVVRFVLDGAGLLSFLRRLDAIQSQLDDLRQ